MNKAFPIKRLLALSFSTIMLSSPAFASPITGEDGRFFGFMQIGDATQGIELTLNEGGTGFSLAGGEQKFGSDDGQITITQASGEFDPILVLAFAAVDIGAPSTFTVSLISPLFPALSGQILSNLSVVGGLTDGSTPGDGSSVSPNANPLVAQATIEGTGVGDAGPAVAYAYDPTRAFSYGPYNVSNIVDCANFGGTCDSFDLSISFLGAGGNDGYAFTAIHEIKEVPEPASFLMLGAGLLGLTRRKFSKAA